MAPNILTFDVETTTRHKGNPFTASNKLVSYAVKVGEQPAEFSYYTAIDFLTALREGLTAASLVIGFNLKFDLQWAARVGIKIPSRVRIWDCQLAEFIINGQKGAYPSLNDCLAKYGLGQKDDRIAEYWALGVDTTDIPEIELKFYNLLDVELTYKLRLKQLEVMSDKQVRLCLLMGLDLLVLREMESNGVKLNVELCKQKEQETREKLEAVTSELLAFAPTTDINLGSDQQLSCFLYGGSFELTTVASQSVEVYKSGKKKGEEYIKNVYRTDVFHCDPLFKPLPRSETKLVSTVGELKYPVWKTGEDVLKQLRATNRKQKRIIELLLLRAEYAKLVDTYYGKLPALLESMEWGQFVHGQYNQCVAATGRLSSSGPNMQNFSGESDELLVTRFAD